MEKNEMILPEKLMGLRRQLLWKPLRFLMMEDDDISSGKNLKAWGHLILFESEIDLGLALNFPTQEKGAASCTPFEQHLEVHLFKTNEWLYDIYDVGDRYLETQ